MSKLVDPGKHARKKSREAEAQQKELLAKQKQIRKSQIFIMK